MFSKGQASAIDLLLVLLLGSASSLPRTTVSIKMSFQHQLLDQDSKVRRQTCDLSFSATRSPLLWQLPLGLRSFSCTQIELLDSHTSLNGLCLVSRNFLGLFLCKDFALKFPRSGDFCEKPQSEKSISLNSEGKYFISTCGIKTAFID